MTMQPLVRGCKNHVGGHCGLCKATKTCFTTYPHLLQHQRWPQYDVALGGVGRGVAAGPRGLAAAGQA